MLVILSPRRISNHLAGSETLGDPQPGSPYTTLDPARFRSHQTNPVTGSQMGARKTT
jgi:hypothetical protein